jgi:rhodanese-related sulfurtransferase
VVYEHPDDEVPHSVLTGDTLFIGDVGRPDLLSAIGFTKEDLASQLYDSLHQKLMTLPDATRVYPAHGAGSACGKNLSTETSSTIGEQRATNYAVAAPDKASFIGMVTEGQPPAPDYFLFDAVLNRKDHGLLDETALPPSMTLVEAQAALDGGAVLVDGRDPEVFAHGHLVGAVNVGLNGRYAEFAGSVIPSDRDIVLFVESGNELEAKNRLGRIGFDRVIGCIADPIQVMIDHPDLVQVASRLTAGELKERQGELDDLQLIDVRNKGELVAGTIPGAIHIPVGELPNRVDELEASRPTVVFCAGGYRSSVAASALRLEDFADVSDLVGGHTAWLELDEHVIV